MWAIPGWTRASWPYSTLDYRHDRDYWEQWFPADFITESFPGQFRNWFYSLLAMSTVLEDEQPSRTVLGYGLMRDEKGREMHKSWGNAIEFNEAAAKVGADAMRWVFMNHNPATNLNFGFSTCDEARAPVHPAHLEHLLVLRHLRQH